MNLSYSRRLTLIAATSGSLFLAACGGGSSASVDDISNKLAKEPSFAQVKGLLPAAQYDKALDCIAQYLHDKGKGSDVDDWIAGKKKLEDVKGDDSASNASQTAQDCVKNATK